MKDRYYFEITTATDGKRYIHFFGNFYEDSEGAYIEEYKGALFALEKFNFNNATQEEVTEFFLYYICSSCTAHEPENYYFSGTEISISDIPATPDGEYYFDMYKQ